MNKKVSIFLLVLPVTVFYVSLAKSDIIGAVTEQTGKVEIQRNRQVISSQVRSGVEMNDSIVTAQARVGIMFNDKSTVQITEQSKLVIDKFIYDEHRHEISQLGIKIAIGTARYTSGQIAKANPKNVKVETPTATVGVRGTDFTLTVDELGRSLIILLPSCPRHFRNIAQDCKTGEIIVQNNMGSVQLTKPFQATVVTAKEKNPSYPVIVNLAADQISNLLILSPPRETKQTEEKMHILKTELNKNYLEKDFFKFDDLSLDFLTKQNLLDINNLDQDFLNTIMEMLTFWADTGRIEENQLLPNFDINKKLGLKYIIDFNRLILMKSSLHHYSEVIVDKDANSQITIIQDLVTVDQVINRNGGSSIIIRQKQ